MHLQGTLRWLVSTLIIDLNKNMSPSLLRTIVGDVYMRDFDRRARLHDHGNWIENQVKGSLKSAKRKTPRPKEGLAEVEQEMEGVEQHAKRSEEVVQPEPAPTDVEGDIHGFLDADADVASTDGEVSKVTGNREPIAVTDRPSDSASKIRYRKSPRTKRRIVLRPQYAEDKNNGMEK